MGVTATPFPTVQANDITMSHASSIKRRLLLYVESSWSCRFIIEDAISMVPTCLGRQRSDIHVRPTLDNLGLVVELKDIG